MVEIIFIGSLFLIAFSYFGYPLTLLVIGVVRGREVDRREYYPSVTFIVTVHNEQSRIKDKLKNILDLDYPRNNLQILVASDGCTDGTNEIVRAYRDQGIELLDIPDR